MKNKVIIIIGLCYCLISCSSLHLNNSGNKEKYNQVCCIQQNNRPPFFVFSEDWIPDQRVRDSTRIVFALSIKGKGKNARVVFHLVCPPKTFRNGSLSESSLSEEETRLIWDTYRKQIETSYIDYCKNYERMYDMERWAQYSHLLLKPED